MSFDAGTVTAELQLDRKPFIASLREARREAARFASRTFTATLDVDNEGRAEIAEAKAEVESLDGKTAEVDVDVDQRSLTQIAGLGGGFKVLASNIRSTGTILKAASIPFAIAAIGAGIPTVAALGASFAGLALNLGEAATGFGLVAAAAGGGALAGLVAYTKLLSSTVSDTRAAWEETHKHTAELLEQRRQTILSTRAASLFNEELNESVIGLSGLQAAVGNRVFPGFTSELDAWNEILKVFQPAIVRTAGAVANAATGFSEWFRTARDGQILADTVAFINRSAVVGANVLADFAKIGVLAFQPLIPLASRLQDSIAGIVDETLRWVNSTEGQNKLSQIYNDLFDSAQRLWPVIRDLSVGIVGFFDALDRTGVADQASRGLASLASSFRDATRAGGGLDTFLRNTRELMPFVADAAKAVGGSILEIASAAIGARDKGSKLTVLQSIFRGIAESAKPLKNLVVGTFQALGPAIAQLLPELSRFFATFAGSSGPLVAFVDIITRGLRIFNNLPDPVKRTVAQLAALKVILGGLGITAVVAPMGRFASNMLIARGAAARLGGKAALPAVVGSIARLGTLLAGGLGLGLLAAGLLRAYQKNEDFRKSVNALGDRAGQVFQGISNKVSNKVLPALTDLADKGAKLLLDIFDLDKGGEGAQTPEQKGVKAVRQFGLGVKTGGENQSKDGGPMEEVGGKMGAAIGRGLNNWAKGGGEGDKGGPQGGLAGFLNRLNVAAQEGGKNWRIGFLKEVNKTNWKAVGNRARTEFFEGLHNFGEGVRNFVDGIRRQINKSKWGGSGRFIAASVLSGLGLASLVPVVLWLDDVRKKISEHRKDFQTSGTNAAAGFLEGFAKANISGGVVGALENAYENFRKKQGEHSPATKLWPQSGKNAALGWLKGFNDTMRQGQGGIQRTLQAAQGTASGRRTVQAARSANSPGGKSITAGEMRDIMREAHKAMAKNIYAAAVAAGLDPRVLKLLDSIMAKDFNFRTNMLADSV